MQYVIKVIVTVLMEPRPAILPIKMEIRIIARIEQWPPIIRIMAARVGGDGINAVDLIAGIKKSFAESSAYKAGAACDEYFLHE